MPLVHQSIVVPYNQAQMFDLVNDIERYPEFVPHCAESKVLSRTEDEIHATLTLSGGGFHKSFTTLNRLQPHKMVEMRLINGPFRHLEGFWLFDEVENNQSKVTLDLEFEFSSGLFGMMFGPIFQQITIKLVNAFHERASQVYG